MDSVFQSDRAGLFFAMSDELMPIRSTTDSAGYDFKAPKTVEIPPHKYVQFDTGVRVNMKKGYVLQLYIRSSLGKKGLTLTNGVGIIDSDFKQNMQAFIMNNSDVPYTIHEGERFMQGIFMRYFITDDDHATGERIGGIGSTGR